MRLLVTGSRDWGTQYYPLMNKVLRHYYRQGYTVLLQGGARGADRQASGLGKEIGYEIETFNAEWSKYGRAAGMIRNTEMLKVGQPSLVAAFHHDIERSKGTRHMVKLALKAGITVHLHTRDLIQELSLEAWDNPNLLGITRAWNQLPNMPDRR